MIAKIQIVPVAVSPHNIWSSYEYLIYFQSDDSLEHQIVVCAP